MSMYPVLEDGTVGTVPIESEAGEHRGLLISVMERGSGGAADVGGDRLRCG